MVIGVSASLLLAACSDSGGRKASSTQPSQSPPTSPAPTTSTSVRTSTVPPSTAAPNLAAVRVRLESVASGLESPVALAWRKGDERMYVAEQGGHVRIVGKNGRVVATPVLSIDVSHGNEQGLLGLDFSRNGTKLYVDYTDPAGDTHVVEYTMRGDVADTATRRELIFQQDPFPNHNGGQVTIGPDNMLYITLGDSGSAGDPNNNGQNLNTLFGKIMRINPRASGSSPYTVPGDNPFAGRGGGVRTEIWMYGLRNPWRFSFDRDNGDVWIGDVGQNKYEEIDYAPAGQDGVNWGWSAREGFHAFKGARPAGARDPLLETDRSGGECAIVGGYVYRGRAVPALDGVYVFGDNCNPKINGVVQRDGRVVQQRDLGVTVDALTSFGEDPQGEVYAIARQGTVYRFAAA
jgi:glucose/arabinose dehydrogenase